MVYFVGYRLVFCVFRIILEIVVWFLVVMFCVLFVVIIGERYLVFYYYLRYYEVVIIWKIVFFIVYFVILMVILSFLRFVVNGVKLFLYINIFGLFLFFFMLFICYWKIYK